MKLYMLYKGIERIKLRVRMLIYWRGLYKDIEEIIKICSICEEF